MQDNWDWVNRGVGQRIAQARKRAGLTQKILADRVSLSRASIANMEAGKQAIQIHMVFELAHQLHVPPLDLIPVISESGILRDLSEIQTIALIKRRIADAQ
jgi:transcriptional regulator with XRE-family HTH domain